MKESGWAKIGERLLGNSIGNRKKHRRISIIAAYNYQLKKLLAPFYYEGYTNTEVFLTWIEKILCPELRENQIIVMDNASFHQSPKIRELIEAKGAKLLYLPKYSPDLNPIEHCWFHLKLKIEKIRKFCENIDEIMKIAFCMSN